MASKAFDFPDGITKEQAEERAGLSRHASPLSILVLGALMLAALLGAFGGGRARPLALSAHAAEVTVTTPRTLRNGEFFETPGRRDR